MNLLKPMYMKETEESIYRKRKDEYAMENKGKIINSPVRKELITGFTSRQYMQDSDFEVFYYNDSTPAHVSSHLHDYYEIYFFLEGNVDYEIAGQTHHLEYGDYLLIPPGISHRPVFRSTESPYRRFVLWINETFYRKLCDQCQDFSYAFDHAGNQERYHYRTDFVQLQQLQAQIIELIEESRGSHSFQRLSRHLLLCQLVLYLNRLTFEMLHQVAQPHTGALYINVCDYINHHLEDDLSLDALADFFYVSKYHISHVFKNSMGISLHQYVLKKRLHACKNGILAGSPVGTLYEQYGFRDYSSFYRAFKKEYGLSPTEFREQHTVLKT